MASQERIWGGVRFREVIDTDINIDGYWVGENGDIWSCWKKGRNPHLTDRFVKKMKQSKRRHGNGFFVTFRGKTKREVPRLVLIAFTDVDRFKDGWIVRHMDGNHANCRLDNLYAVDVKEYFSTCQGNGSTFFRKKLCDDQGLEIIKLLINGVSQREICSLMNCNHKVVMRIRKMINDAMLS